MASTDLLDRFPLLATTGLAEARQATSQFWPAHESETLGPEEYSLVLNRVTLAAVSISFVRCTARVRVRPLEPNPAFCLIAPLSGEVEIDTDRGGFRATPEHPLLRGPGVVSRFESSPTRCLLVDIPVAAVQPLAGGLPSPPPCGWPDHHLLDGGMAKTLLRRLRQLVATVNRSRRVPAIQSRSDQDRIRLMPADVRQQEQAVLTEVALIASGPGRRGGERELAMAGSDARDLDTLKAWLAANSTNNRSLTELATQAGLSMRGLQRLFAKAGFTPQGYLIGVRLDRARAMLAAASPATTVADVAVMTGFPHRSRFAAAYRERFGELPSATLDRGLGGQGGRGA